jgi:uncharacterized damage-inducible protein DinB
MPIAEALAAEFAHEASTTRKLLERVPDGKFDWKPHVKSMSLGTLSSHVANLPQWAVMTLDQSEFDLATAPPSPEASSRAQLVAMFDQHVGAATSKLAGKTDAELMAPWTLKHGGHPVFTMPKAAVLRSFVMNHLIHHRGQLSVYLRLNEVPLPSIYGPTADEPM